MQLTLAVHPIEGMRFGGTTRITGTQLEVNQEELRRHLLEDGNIASVEFDLAWPGESCRIAGVTDILEPRAKEPDSGTNYPGMLSPYAVAGQGTTHVLRGAVVTCIAEGAGPQANRLVEMSGAPADVSVYGGLHHLVIIPRTRAGLDRYQAATALRLAVFKAGVYLAEAGFLQPPAAREVLTTDDADDPERKGLPRVAYIAQVFSHQTVAEPDEKIIYGHNTVGMLPVPLHPNEWLDGGVTCPASAGNGMETYFYQNQPVILELYRLHQARQLNLVGTIAMVAAGKPVERDRNCMMAANLAKWNLRADVAVFTKTGGGAPHADMGLTAQYCELSGIKTAVQVNNLSNDGRAESALLFNHPEVDAIVAVGSLGGGRGVTWSLPTAERVIAASPAIATRLAAAQNVGAGSVCGVMSQQGASRLQTTVY